MRNPGEHLRKVLQLELFSSVRISMTKPAVLLRRSLIFVHRWLGVCLSLLFLLWFVSGIVMMYRRFPDVSREDRLERAPVLDATKIKLSVEEAHRTLEENQAPGRVLLNTLDDRPVYRFGAGRRERIVYADDGAAVGEVPRETLRRIASAWTRQPIGTAKEEAIETPDQWVVQGQLRNLRPMWKYSVADGQQVYVSATSAEVVQYTTTASRFWADVGAIPHWLYFAPLRKRPAWSPVVIWSSGIASVAASIGLTIGIWMYSPRKRYRYRGVSTSLPYRGQKRWHMILGLTFGVLVCTWSFSGMLSMEPFPTRSVAKARSGLDEIPRAMRGALRLEAYAGKHPSEALRQAGDFGARELELAMIMSEPMYVATSTDGRSLFVPLRGEPFREFSQERVIDALKAAAQPAELDIQVLSEYDAYYLDRSRRRPLPVLLVREKDSDGTRYYIDPKTARVVGSYSSSEWVERWLYRGLHSLDFPMLYNHRPLWDIIVLTLMLGGTALCVTSVIMGWRVVGRKLSRGWSSQSPEDLAAAEKW